MKNQLPKNWEIVNLSDYVFFQEGPGIRSSEYKVEGCKIINVRCVQDGYLDLSTARYISWEKANNDWKHFFIKENDILFTTSGTIGRVATVKKEDLPLMMNTSVVRFRPFDTEKLIYKYLEYFLRSNFFLNQINRQVTEMCIRNVGPTHIKKTKIILPPVKEQKRIVSILEEVERVKGKREEINKKMEELIPALFIKMFGDPATNPMGWERVPLNKLGSLDRGKSQHRPRTAPELFGGPYPFIQTGDIANAGWKIKNYTKTYSEIGLAQSKLWPRNTLCITIAANIADVAILDFEACFPDSVVGFISNENSDIHYIYSLFIFLKKNLEKIAPRAAQKNINLEILRGLLVPKPPIDLQKKFAERVKEIEKQKEKQLKSLEDINNLFNSLMQKAFRGEL